MIKVIEDGTSWKKTLELIGTYDFYHTYDYHQLSKKEGEKPILVVYEEENTKLAVPFLKRDIKGTPYADLTSVYGYAGPIAKKLGPEFSNKGLQGRL